MRLADYFAVLEARETNGARKIEILHRWPAFDADSGSPFPKEVLPIFCFPKGLEFDDNEEIVQRKPNSRKRSVSAEDSPSWQSMVNSAPNCYSFVLTDTDGTKRHATCLSFRRAVANEFRRTVLCVLSVKPYYSLFEANLVHILRRLSSIDDDFNGEQLPPPERLVSLLVELEVPVGSCSFELESCGRRCFYRVACTHEFGLPVIDDAMFRILFSCLSPDMVVILLENVLLERRIMIHSRHPQRLTAVATAITCLLYPFEWSHVFIPVLPHQLVHYLQAPMPYIIGVLSSVLSTDEWLDIEDEQRPQVIVHIDDNFVEDKPLWRQQSVNRASKAAPPPAPRLPDAISELLTSKLFSLIPASSGSRNHGENSAGVIWQSSLSNIEFSLPDSEGTLVEEKRDFGDPFLALSGGRDMEWIDVARTYFCSAIVGLLIHSPSDNDFREFLLEDDDSGRKIDAERFLSRAPVKGNGFLSCLIQTQMFAQFIDHCYPQLIKKQRSGSTNAVQPADSSAVQILAVIDEFAKDQRAVAEESGLRGSGIFIRRKKLKKQDSASSVRLSSQSRGHSRSRTMSAEAKGVSPPIKVSHSRRETASAFGEFGQMVKSAFWSQQSVSPPLSPPPSPPPPPPPPPPSDGAPMLSFPDTTHKSSASYRDLTLEQTPYSVKEKNSSVKKGSRPKSPKKSKFRRLKEFLAPEISPELIQRYSRKCDITGRGRPGAGVGLEGEPRIRLKPTLGSLKPGAVAKRRKADLTPTDSELMTFQMRDFSASLHGDASPKPKKKRGMARRMSSFAAAMVNDVESLGVSSQTYADVKASLWSQLLPTTGKRTIARMGRRGSVMMRKNFESMPKRFTSSKSPNKNSAADLHATRNQDMKSTRFRSRRTSTIDPKKQMRESFETVVFRQFSQKKRRDFLELAKEHKELVLRLQENEEKLLAASAKVIIWNHRYKMKKAQK